METEKANHTLSRWREYWECHATASAAGRNRTATQDVARACRIEAVKALHKDKRGRLGIGAWSLDCSAKAIVCRQRRACGRQFDVSVSNKAWCADIAAIWAFGGWLYLAALVDLRDRQIVEWAIGFICYGIGDGRAHNGFGAPPSGLGTAAPFRLRGSRIPGSAATPQHRSFDESKKLLPGWSDSFARSKASELAINSIPVGYKPSRA